MTDQENEKGIYDNEREIIEKGEILPSRLNFKESLLVNHDEINFEFFKNLIARPRPELVIPKYKIKKHKLEVQDPNLDPIY